MTNLIKDSSVHDLREGVPAILPGVGKDCEFAGQPHHAYADDAVAMALPKEVFEARK
jgi:hypothetical protein